MVNIQCRFMIFCPTVGAAVLALFSDSDIRDLVGLCGIAHVCAVDTAFE